MNLIPTVITAILVFSFLIFIHEFGHYIFARIFKVSITEFSIGMGPKLVWYDSKKTGIRYALSAIPIGGYVAMVGEDGESDDPNAFNKKPAWQRLIITVAGAVINIIAGLIAMIIFASVADFGGTTVTGFANLENATSSQEYGIELGDEIIRVDGKRVKTADALFYEIMRNGNKPLDLTIIRNGEEMILEDVSFPILTESGQTFGYMDFSVNPKAKTFGSVLSYAFSKSALTVRMCWESIFDLITGRYSLAAVSGPVGISQAIGDAAEDGPGPLLNIVSLISINLGVMNLLPLPALDGGRTVMILAEMITKKKLPSNVEATINAVGLALLLGLSFIVMIKDVVALFF